jgi:hypothetical protein
MRLASSSEKYPCTTAAQSVEICSRGIRPSGRAAIAVCQSGSGPRAAEESGHRAPQECGNHAPPPYPAGAHHAKRPLQDLVDNIRALAAARRELEAAKTLHEQRKKDAQQAQGALPQLQKQAEDQQGQCENALRYFRRKEVRDRVSKWMESADDVRGRRPRRDTLYWLLAADINEALAHGGKDSGRSTSSKAASSTTTAASGDAATITPTGPHPQQQYQDSSTPPPATEDELKSPREMLEEFSPATDPISMQALIASLGTQRIDCRDVLIGLIAVLRHQFIDAVRNGGETVPRARHIKEALDAAYRQRQDMVYIRPGWTYLRNSYPASALQQDPNLRWQNMIEQHVQRQQALLPTVMGNDTSYHTLVALYKQYWQNVNQVRLAGGGDTNYVVAKDDVGNGTSRTTRRTRRRSSIQLWDWPRLPPARTSARACNWQNRSAKR